MPLKKKSAISNTKTEPRRADAKDSHANEGGEERLAKYGFILHDGHLQGTAEGDQLATTLADIFKAMKDGSPDKA